jgi:phosphoribosylformimino-5-aminoimidazole carboxamide ribotide isomerase
MQLIPVIDIKNGCAVHAKLGLREFYQPLNTPLCQSADVNTVIQAFLQLYPFSIMYLADLNAISGQGENLRLIKQLLKSYPQIKFWIDSGYQAQPGELIQYPNYQAVLGSESYSEDKLSSLSRFEGNFVLSLDFSAEQPLGAARLFSDVGLWSEKIIIMTLARVGSYSGVDVEKLEYFKKLAPQKTLIASGGISGIADLKHLQHLGIHYALCASALHSGAIGKQELAAINAEPNP